MANTISIEIGKNFIQLNVSGVYDKAEFLTYPEMVLGNCNQSGIKKAILNTLDVDWGDLKTLDRFYLGEQVAKTLGTSVKLVAVCPPQVINYFAENVAFNRGANFRVMGDIESAKSWLLNTF